MRSLVINMLNQQSQCRGDINTRLGAIVMVTIDRRGWETILNVTAWLLI